MFAPRKNFLSGIGTLEARISVASYLHINLPFAQHSLAIVLGLS